MKLKSISQFLSDMSFGQTDMEQAATKPNFQAAIDHQQQIQQQHHVTQASAQYQGLLGTSTYSTFSTTGSTTTNTFYPGGVINIGQGLGGTSQGNINVPTFQSLADTAAREEIAVLKKLVANMREEIHKLHEEIVRLRNIHQDKNFAANEILKKMDCYLPV